MKFLNLIIELSIIDIFFYAKNLWLKKKRFKIKNKHLLNCLNSFVELNLSQYVFLMKAMFSKLI